MEEYMPQDERGSEWFYSERGDWQPSLSRMKGPFTADQLRELFVEKKINGDTLMWRNGNKVFVPLRLTRAISDLDQDSSALRGLAGGSEPPPLHKPSSHEPPQGTASPDGQRSGSSDERDRSDWFYSDRGDRKGPVAARMLRDLVNQRRIGAETPVWRKGLASWIPLREAGILAELSDVPPPLSPALINNSLVWVVAFLPLVFAIVDYSIGEFYLESHGVSPRDILIGRGLVMNSIRAVYSVPWWVVLIANSLLCIWDERRLNKAGYDTNNLVWAALLFVPAYLFVRAKRLQQTPSYAVVWVIAFVFSLLV